MKQGVVIGFVPWFIRLSVTRKVDLAVCQWNISVWAVLMIVFWMEMMMLQGNFVPQYNPATLLSDGGLNIVQHIQATSRKRKGHRRRSANDANRSGEADNTMQNSSDGNGRQFSPLVGRGVENGQTIQRQHVQNVYTPFPVGRGSNSGVSTSHSLPPVFRVEEVFGASLGTVFQPTDVSLPAGPEDVQVSREPTIGPHSHRQRQHRHRHERVSGFSNSPAEDVELSGTDAYSGASSAKLSSKLPVLVPVPDFHLQSPSSSALSLLQQSTPVTGPLCRSRSSSSLQDEQTCNRTWRGSAAADTRGVDPRSGRQGRLHSTPCSPSASRDCQPSENYLYLYARLPKVSCNTDLERLNRTMYGLDQGQFYYKSLDNNAARAMLRDSPEGTFLVRDSSDPKFLFSLSVKTARGATSVRVEYFRGHFQLDCEDAMKRKLPRFETLPDLLDFHSTVCKNSAGGQYRWLDSSRRKDMAMQLTTPLRHTPPSLQHLARVTINQQLEDLHLPSRSTDLLPLPDKMKKFLRAYPYKL